MSYYDVKVVHETTQEGKKPKNTTNHYLVQDQTILSAIAKIGEALEGMTYEVVGVSKAPVACVYDAPVLESSNYAKIPEDVDTCFYKVGVNIQNDSEKPHVERIVIEAHNIDTVKTVCKNIYGAYMLDIQSINKTSIMDFID